MLALLSLLFAPVAAAEVTTSIWFPEYFVGTERIGFLGSVIGADKDVLTLALNYDNDTDTEQIGLATRSALTFTVAPTLFEFSTTGIRMGRPVSTDPGDYAQNYRCERKKDDEDATCSLSLGLDFAVQRACNSRTVAPTAYTRIFSFSADSTQPATVETYVLSANGGPLYTPLPSFCLNSDLSQVSSVPQSFRELKPSALDANDIGTYQVVITAGEEKMSATAGGSASNAGTANPTEGTGVAVPMKTAAPALAGLGAAMAMFL